MGRNLSKDVLQALQMMGFLLFTLDSYPRLYPLFVFDTPFNVAGQLNAFG